MKFKHPIKLTLSLNYGISVLFTGWAWIITGLTASRQRNFPINFQNKFLMMTHVLYLRDTK